MKVSKTGYKKNSKDKNEKSLLIPSNQITMKDVEFPVFGTDDTGYSQMMYPGLDYSFPGNYVYELPMAKNGGYILPGRYRNPEGNWVSKYASGGDISIPDLSRGWLDKYQPGGGVIDPLYGQLSREEADSLTLYNAYQHSLKNNIKGYEQWLNDMGSTYPGGPAELRKVREKNTGVKYGQKINNDKKSRYKKPAEEVNFDPAYSEDNKVIDYYKSLVGTDPNFRIGRHSSPDLWHKTIMPIGMFYDGSETPIYKRPSFVKDNKPTKKPKLDQQAVMQQILKDYPGYSIKFENDRIFIREPETEYEIDNGIHNIWQPLPIKKSTPEPIQYKGLTGFDRPEQELKSSTTKIGSTKTKPIMRSAQDTKTGQYQIGYNYWDDNTKSWKQKMFSKETQQQNYDDVKVPSKKTIKVPPGFQNGGWLDKYQPGGQASSKYDLMRVDQPTAVASSTNVVVPNIDFKKIKTAEKIKELNDYERNIQKIRDKQSKTTLKNSPKQPDVQPDVYEQESYLPENYSEIRRRPGVSGSMVTVFVDPKTGEEWISPGQQAAQEGYNKLSRSNNIDPIFTGIASALVAAPLVRPALSYLNAPAVLPYFGEVPWLTAANVLGAAGATDAILNRFPEIPGQLLRGEYMDAGINALTGTLDLFGANMVSPFKASKVAKQLPESTDVDPELEAIRKILRKNVTYPKHTGPASEPGPWPNRFLEQGDNAWSIGNMETGRTSDDISDIPLNLPIKTPRQLPGVNGTLYPDRLPKQLPGSPNATNASTPRYLPDMADDVDNMSFFDPFETANINKQVKEGNTWLQNWFSNPATAKRIADTGFDESSLVKKNIEDFKGNKNVVRYDPSLDAWTGNELGIYFPKKNKAYVDAAHYSFLDGSKSIPSTVIHEGTHLTSAGDLAYNQKLTDLITDIFKGDDVSEFAKIFLSEDDIKQLNKLISPPETHARIMQIRQKYNIKPEQIVDDTIINKIIEDGLSGKLPVSKKFFELIKNKNAFKKAMNTLPAIGTGIAIGTGGLQEKKTGGWLDKYQDAGQVNTTSKQPFYESTTEPGTYETTYLQPEVTIKPKWTEAELERNRLIDEYIIRDKRAFGNWYDKLGYNRKIVEKRAEQYAYNQLAKQYLKGDRDKLTDQQKRFIQKSEYASRLQPTVGSRFVEGVTNPGFNLETLSNLAAPFEYPSNLVRGAVKGEFADAVKGYTPSPYFVSSDRPGTSPTEAAIMSGLVDVGVDIGFGALEGLNLVDDAARAGKYFRPKQLPGSPNVSSSKNIEKALQLKQSPRIKSSEYLANYQLAKELQTKELLKKSVDPKLLARYPNLFDNVTKAALKKYNTTYRAVTPDISNASLDELIAMSKAGVTDFFDLDQIAKYMSTHVPLVTKGYRANPIAPESWQDLLYTGKYANADEAAKNLSSYGTYLTEVRPKMDFSTGDKQEWIEKYYDQLPFAKTSTHFYGGDPALKINSVWKQGTIGAQRGWEYWPYIGTRGSKVLEAIRTKKIRKYGGSTKWLDDYQDGGDYNMQRALELGYQPDETGHWGSVDSETGMWLKSKKHPTAWMEYMYGQLDPEIVNNYNVITNPEGYFGENQLQYVPKVKKYGGDSQGMGYLNYIGGYKGVSS